MGIAPDLEQFQTTWDRSGLSLNVSTILARQLDATQLLDQYSFGRTCTFVSRQAFEQNHYQGQMEIWDSCDGGTQNMLFVATFTPADRAFIGLLIFQTTKTDELEIMTHLLNTLSVDVDAINVAPTPTATPAPTRTPTRRPTATATPEPVTATVLVETLNVRTGPGTNYAILGAAKRNQTFTVIGQANSCAWVLIQDSSDKKGWLAAGNQYARVNGGCTVPSSTEILAAPTAAGGGGRTPVSPPQPTGDGCITFENQLNVELTITFTGQSGQGSRDFKVGSHASQRQCFTPGPYTPTPWMPHHRGTTLTAIWMYNVA